MTTAITGIFPATPFTSSLLSFRATSFSSPTIDKCTFQISRKPLLTIFVSLSVPSTTVWIMIISSLAIIYRKIVTFATTLCSTAATSARLVMSLQYDTRKGMQFQWSSYLVCAIIPRSYHSCRGHENSLLYSWSTLNLRARLPNLP